jgi:hypothetical protein
VVNDIDPAPELAAFHKEIVVLRLESGKLSLDTATPFEALVHNYLSVTLFLEGTATPKPNLTWPRRWARPLRPRATESRQTSGPKATQSKTQNVKERVKLQSRHTKPVGTKNLRMAIAIGPLLRTILGKWAGSGASGSASLARTAPYASSFRLCQWGLRATLPAPW